MKNKKKLIWILVALLLAVLTFHTIFRMSEGLSFRTLLRLLYTAQPGYLLLACAAMLGFIILEGEALRLILRSFDCPCSRSQGLLYSAADIYFSAITPSASGGQPASAYFMVKNRIPGAAVTVALLVNLVAYTAATWSVGVMTLLLWPNIFRAYDLTAKLLIVFGLVALSGLALLFWGLLRRGETLFRWGERGLRLLARLRIVKKPDDSIRKLRDMVDQYENCASLAAGKRKMLLGVYALDFAQRLSQISVTVLIHLALRGQRGLGGRLWACASYAQIGSNCVPIPGGMGVADYLLYQGFTNFFHRETALRLMLVSRSVSFYFCALLSGLISLVGYCVVQYHKGESQ